MKKKSLSIVACILLLISFIVGCQQKESDEKIIKYSSKLKEKNKNNTPKKGIEHIADYQKQIRKGIYEEKSTYKKGYLIEEFNKAKQNLLARNTASTISAVFTERGPNNVPGRSRGIAIDPNNSNRWFVGTVGGGIWLTEDSGTTWTTLTDFEIPNLATSTIVISQTNSNTLYVGTGEPFGNLDAIGGSGVFKTTDGGTTWQHLTATASLGDVGRIIINPADDSNLLMGTSSGIYRTTDGGLTWNQTYNSLGRVQDLDADPTDFNIQYGSVRDLGLVKSTDAGITWSLVFDRADFNTNHNRFETSVSPADPNTVFLSVYSGSSGATVGVNTDFYVSRDKGVTFTNLTTTDANANLLTGQGWYDNVIMAHPYDADIFYVGGVAVFKVTVSGSTFTSTSIASGYDSNQINSGVHVDQHGLFPILGTSNEFKILLANDGGVYSTTMKEDPGATEGDWSSAVTGKNSTQFYGAAKQNGFDNYLAGAQDNGCWIALSNNATANESYQFAFGGDGFEVIWHYNNPRDFIVSSQFGRIGKYANFSYAGQVSLTSSPFYTKVANADNNPNVVFAVSSNGVWRSTNFGTNWSLTPISFNLGASSSLNVKVSTADPNVVWAGVAMTESGSYVLHVSQDNGQSFTGAAAYNNPNGSHNLFISGLATSYIERNRAYALFSSQGKPKILKTEDLGATWSDITGFETGTNTGFPDVAVHSVLEMPFDKDIIWAGTDIGLFQTEDGGTNWSMITDLPAVAVYDMKVVNDQVVIATHGRGIWSATITELSTYTLPTYARQWTGAVSTDWATAGNWDTGIVPTASDNVTISNGLPNYPTVTSAVTVNSVTIESGASLIAQNTFTGNITYHLGITDTNWHLVSSPVIGQQYDDAWVNANGIALGTGTNRGISTYDNGTPDATTQHWRYLQAGNVATFTSGIGYAALRTGTGTYGFTGSYPTTDVTPTITQDHNHWNLLGNPYPSYIDIASFITENTSNLSEGYKAVYVWDGTSPTTGNYNPLIAGYIHPGQGFFVHSNVASGTVSITEAMQSHQADINFYRNNLPTINLTLSDGDDIKNTQINYVVGKTKGLDPRFDLGMFDGTSSNLRIYTHLITDNEGIAFDIQALPNSDYESMIVPVGVKADAGKEITFSVEALNLPTGLNVYLEDREANIFTRLDETDTEYTITLSEAVNGVGRFYLHTSSQVLGVSNVDLVSVAIYSANQKIHFSGLPEGNTFVTLYDVLGKVVLEEKITENTNSISAENISKGGVYLVRLITEKGKISKKIVLQ